MQFVDLFGEDGVLFFVVGGYEVVVEVGQVDFLFGCIYQFQDFGGFYGVDGFVEFFVDFV